MDIGVGRDRLEEGDWIIGEEGKKWDVRQRYLDGDHDLPYAPQGVNEEYQELQRQSIMNWLWLAMNAPVQRLKPDGFRFSREDSADTDTWKDVYQANSLDSRITSVFMDMYCHGRGIMSVWPNKALRKSPVIRPEDGRNIHLEGDMLDPWTQAWAVKRIDRTPRKPRNQSRLWTPASVRETPESVQFGYVYDRDSWMSFKREVRYSAFGNSTSEWIKDDEGEHDLGHVPLVPFDHRPKSNAKPRPGITALIPAQDALNTIRFQTLLAMQFSAFRQRIVSGYDPVARTADGQPIYRKDGDGELILDGNGLPIPIVVSPGRPGVDRLLVFPGDATKVFDLAESNLDNYVKVLQEFLTQLFAVGQIPPQYLLSRMTNISGDALTAAESTLEALAGTLKTSAGESLELVMRMANIARGDDSDGDLASEVIWGVTEVRSFAQVVDGIVKLIASGMAPEDAWAMLPGATPPMIEDWVKHADERLRKALLTAGVKADGSPQTPGLPQPQGPKPAPGAQPGGNGGRRPSA